MALFKQRQIGESIPIERMRSYAVALVTDAIAISYFDRQTLPVAISSIQCNIPISNQQFSYLQTSFLLAYAALYAIGGRLLDCLGTCRGFMLIMLWWSIAFALHGLASGFMLLLIARFLLGIGEGDAFPAAIRVVAEWVPQEERSTAVGFINAGTAIGSVLAPPLIGFVLLNSDWRAVFVSAGAVGLAWVLWWMLTYGKLFVLVGTFHLIGFLAILLFAGKIQPLRPHDLMEIESIA